MKKFLFESEAEMLGGRENFFPIRPVAIDSRGLGKMLLKPGTFLVLFRQNAFETRNTFLENGQNVRGF